MCRTMVNTLGHTPQGQVLKGIFELKVKNMKNSEIATIM